MQKKVASFNCISHFFCGHYLLVELFKSSSAFTLFRRLCGLKRFTQNSSILIFWVCQCDHERLSRYTSCVVENTLKCIASLLSRDSNLFVVFKMWNCRVTLLILNVFFKFANIYIC